MKKGFIKLENMGDYEKEQGRASYRTVSDELDCDVLCVDHWGTSWDYVLTDVKLFDNWEDLEKYESEEN